MNLTLKLLLLILIIHGLISCKQGTVEQIGISLQVIELEDQTPTAEEKRSVKIDQAKESLNSTSEELTVILDQH